MNLQHEKRTTHAYWAVVPAAGVGARMGARIPKQYLPLAGKTVIEHTLARFCEHPAISGVVVAISATDSHWRELSISSHPRVLETTGGEQRCHSVLAGLARLREVANPDDWVLVHDAARPCLHTGDIDRLIQELSNHEVGGLLALPARDTIKRGDVGRNVVETIDRNTIWYALTPQMFRCGALAGAIEDALNKGSLVTDEAQAMEMAGMAPRLVEGRSDNIKITRPEDLSLAELFLRRRQAEAPCE